MRPNLKLTLGGTSSTAGVLRRGCVLLTFLLCGCVTAAAQTEGSFELLSVNGAGSNGGNGDTFLYGASADGRFALMVSPATDLVANDTNGPLFDVFVRDAQQHTTALVSVNAAGTGSGNGQSFNARMTPDGRFVVFESAAEDLVANDNNGELDVFVRDLVAQTTTLASINAAGTGSGGGGRSTAGYISANGRYVVFWSAAQDLVAGDTNQLRDAFRRDLLTGTTALVSVNMAGTNGANHVSFPTAVSADGRYVLFLSIATDLVANDTNGPLFDIFRRDMQTGTTALASVNDAGTASGNRDSYDPSGYTPTMSDDGRVVAFRSLATNLAPGAANGFDGPSLYAHDFGANTTTLIGKPPDGQGRFHALVSGDGRFVFYRERNGFLNSTGTHDTVVRHDLLTGDVFQLPYITAASGACEDRVFFTCNSTVEGFTVSRNGRYVGYQQTERAGAGRVSTSTADFVIRDLVGGGTEIFLDNLGSYVISDGGNLAFSSRIDHAAPDSNGVTDAYFLAFPAQTKLAFVNADFIYENGPVSSIRVRRTGYLIDSTSTVKYATSDGTATAGSDYVAQSGTLTFAPGESVKEILIQLIDDKLFEPDEVLNLTLSDPTGDSTLGSRSSTTVTIRTDEFYGFQFSAPSYRASEAVGGIHFTVTLVGSHLDFARTLSVDYATSDGTAGERSDYITQSGRLTFEPGQTSKVVRVLVVDDNLVEGDETFNVSLSNPQGSGAGLGSPSSAGLKILDDDTTPSTSNPIDGSAFFVRQHYLDFLHREPDAEGLQFWTNEIESCGTDAQCREVKRINVSAAFYLSIELQNTSPLVYLAHRAASGPGTGGSPAPVLYGQFMHDIQQLQQNLVFGQLGFDEQLEANKRAYFADFVVRPEFGAAYPTRLTPAQFVDALNANAGQVLDAAERGALVNGLTNGTMTRAQVLRRVAENPSFTRAEFNRAFVLMQYFGYLRRDPDAAGFAFWLGKLDEFGGDFVRAEMVKAFLNSEEYRKRFGQ